MFPQFLVLGALPMKDRHFAINIKTLIERCLSEYSIDTSKVHLFLRDAASSMKAATELLDEDSFDCFAHRLNLVVQDGLRAVSGYEELLDKIQRLIRKVRTSERHTFANLQKELELDEQVLIKSSNVRWNSSYDMIARLVKNREAVDLFCSTLPRPKNAEKTRIEFSNTEWQKLEGINEVLYPVAAITKALQDRTTSISVVIPTVVVMRDHLKKPAMKGKVDLLPMKRAMLEGLDRRMNQWMDNANLVLATLLDPRYKMTYFAHLPSGDQDKIRISLVMEVEELLDDDSSALSADESESESSRNDSAVYSLFSAYEQKYNHEPPRKKSKSSIEARHRAEVEVDAYLREKRIALDADPFEYWRKKGILWKELRHLVRRFHSAPAGSMESERLFSTAGAIVTELRKRLLVENVENLLFTHHNLAIYDYKYT